MNAPKQIPVLLITGFLGSGKTTFINWLLEHNQDKKISLILNEFGDVKLESQFITQTAGGEVAELANGCMCCVAKSDIPRVIKYILEHSPQTEHIIIEASGLSDPDPILESLQSSELTSVIRLDTIVCMIDTQNFEQTRHEHSIIMSQIGDADIVLLNKVTQADQETIERITQAIQRIGIGTTVLKWNDQLDSSIFLEPNLQQTRPIHNHNADSNKHTHHDHQAYNQAWFTSDKTIDMAKLSTIMRQLPRNIIRAKGIINWEQKKVLLQYVGTKLDFIETEWKANEPKSTAILFLGKQIDTASLLAQLATTEQ